jgi:predicted house-cleaning noncanonical NTP pyrophosphatase (MazG superfamily)
MARKLVRDNIPHMIEQDGRRVQMHVCSDQEFRERLRDKLQEEVNEFLQDNAVEELADILEVVYALANLSNVSPQQLEAIRCSKAQERGGFSKRIVIDNLNK